MPATLLPAQPFWSEPKVPAFPVHFSVLPGVHMKESSTLVPRLRMLQTPRATCPAQEMLRDFLASSLVLQEEWDLLTPEKRQPLLACTDLDVLLNVLID